MLVREIINRPPGFVIGKSNLQPTIIKVPLNISPYSPEVRPDTLIPHYLPGHLGSAVLESPGPLSPACKQ